MVKQVQTIVTLTDDLDGSKADRTVGFAFNGVSYEIDLSRKNANALEKTLAPYIAASRKISNRRRGGRAGTATRATRRPDVAGVREWARANGYDVSDRGRIPGSIVEAYKAAN
jgi:hypothetical protein